MQHTGQGNAADGASTRVRARRDARMTGRDGGSFRLTAVPGLPEAAPMDRPSVAARAHAPNAPPKTEAFRAELGVRLGGFSWEGQPARVRLSAPGTLGGREPIACLPWSHRRDPRRGVRGWPRSSTYRSTPPRVQRSRRAGWNALAALGVARHGRAATHDTRRPLSRCAMPRAPGTRTHDRRGRRAGTCCVRKPRPAPLRGAPYAACGEPPRSRLRRCTSASGRPRHA